MSLQYQEAPDVKRLADEIAARAVGMHDVRTLQESANGSLL